MKLLTNDKALELAEKLLQNDRDIKEEIKEEIEKKIPNTDNFATEDYVKHSIAQAQLGGSGNGNVDLSGFATKSELSGYAEKSHTHSGYLTSVPEEYVTQTEMTNAIANAQLGGGNANVDLSGYATKDALATKADNEHNHDGKYQPKGNYATKSYVIE
jgi:hypothetical protein